MTKVPSFLVTTRSKKKSASRPLGGTISPSVQNKLAFTMETQTQTQWCWAAVSTSISQFFHTTSTWTQCSVANSAWSRSDCCGSGAGGLCNNPWYLNSALEIVDAFDRMTSAVENFATSKSEIDSGRPLCLRVGWLNGGGHFLSIIGWKKTPSGTEYYNVDDPIYGNQTILKSALETNYRGSGTWTHSYFVTKNAGGGAKKMRSEFDDPEMLGA